MKQYTVIWWHEAEEELLRAWLDSNRRAEITTASHEIDQMLSSHPESHGSSPHEGLYRLEVPPLRIQYSVELQDRKVTVWTVRLTE